MPLLFAHGINRFSHDVAHSITIIILGPNFSFRSLANLEALKSGNVYSEVTKDRLNMPF